MRQAFLLSLAFAVSALVSCNRDPNVAKRRYLESGNKYFARAKYKEARLMYKDAIGKDRLYGPAYYKLGLTEVKLGGWSAAVNAFHRAIELLPPSSPDHWDAMIQISQIYLIAGGDQKPLQSEVEEYANELLAHDSKSYDGHRLLGDLNFRRAIDFLGLNLKDSAMGMFAKAFDEFSIANGIKPGQNGVVMQMARCQTARGNTASAEQLYRQVIDHDKTQADAYAELYRLYMMLNRPADGEQVLKLAIQNNPQTYAFLTDLAQHYAQQGRPGEMVTVLQQIKSHAKDYADAYQVVGDFYLRLGDGDSAVREYRDGIAKDARHKTVYQKKIIEVLMRQGKRTEAADLVHQILKQDPNDNDAKGVAATLLLDNGEVNQALTDLTAVVTHAPNNFVARYQLGRAYEAKSEWELARQQFQKAIDIRSDYFPAWLALGQLQVARGDFDAALKTSEEIVARDRSNMTGLLIRTAALIGEKRFPEARRLLEAVAKSNPNSTDIQYQLGLLNLAENKPKDAEAAFRKSYDLNPGVARGLMGVVETYMSQNQPDKALAMVQAESAKAPNRPEFHVAAGNIAARSGKFDVAISEYEGALDTLDKNSRNRGEIYFRMGEVYRRKGDDANAIAALQKAREALPDNDTILVHLAMTLQHAGRWSEAKQLYEATLKVAPNDGVALNNIAFLTAEHGGDLNDALTKVQRAKQLLPNMGEVSDTLGYIYLKQNLAEQALEIFRDLTTKSPNVSTYRYHLGMALAQHGDKTAAIRELQQALKANPEPDEKEKIQQALNRLNGA